MKAYYLTTPIYYVNALPHLGHAYTTIVADAMTRFQRLMGREAMFISGTDEHGDKIVQAAEKAGKSVQALTDEVSGAFRALWPRLESEPARFVRTTSPEHKAVVQAFLQRVYEAGDIYFGEYGGHYCYGCERFYTEKELEDGLCPQHLVKPEYISEKNYFFRMSRYQDWLKGYILDNPDFIRPERYRAEVLALLESGALDDLCISRPKTRLTWGIELPFDPEYVCYVWFDALLAYTTALGGPGAPDFERFWPEAEHLVAKDILKPHAVFWPTMLKAAGLPLYRHLNVHGYWLARDTKMSKSIGNVVAPLDMVEKFGLDAFRYFLLREMHFGADGSFSEEAMVGRINADLANDLGNLFSRVLSMTAKFRDSRAPDAGLDGAVELELKSLADDCLANFRSLFAELRFSNALESLWELVRALNKYVDSSAPWALAKAGEVRRLDTVLRSLLDSMRRVAMHLLPVMPGAASQMLSQLGLDPAHCARPGALANGADDPDAFAPGTLLAPSSNIFPRLETMRAAEAQSAKGGEKSGAGAKSAPATSGGGANEARSEEAGPGKEAADHETPALIAFEDFQKLDLRVGLVLSCERHPNADKLLRVMVDLGEEEPRQILAGIAAFYQPEDLPGRQVTVLANLKPRKMRGLESQGMILAVHRPDGLELLAPSGPVPPGSKVS